MTQIFRCMVNINLWKTSTKSIFTGVILYSICGIATALLGLLTITSASISALVGSGNGLEFVALFGVLVMIAVILMIVGYIKYYRGIGNFRNAVDEADKPTVQRIYTAITFLIVGTAISLSPFIGFLGNIANIVAFSLMFLAYKDLSASTTFPEMARKGAKYLYIAMIVSLFSVALTLIPTINIIDGILSIVSYVIVFMGWSKIKNATNK